MLVVDFGLRKVSEDGYGLEFGQNERLFDLDFADDIAMIKKPKVGYRLVQMQ